MKVKVFRDSGAGITVTAQRVDDEPPTCIAQMDGEIIAVADERGVRLTHATPCCDSHSQMARGAALWACARLLRPLDPVLVTELDYVDGEPHITRYEAVVTDSYMEGTKMIMVVAPVSTLAFGVSRRLSVEFSVEKMSAADLGSTSEHIVVYNDESRESAPVQH